MTVTTGIVKIELECARLPPPSSTNPFDWSVYAYDSNNPNAGYLYMALGRLFLVEQTQRNPPNSTQDYTDSSTFSLLSMGQVDPVTGVSGFVWQDENWARAVEPNTGLITDISATNTYGYQQTGYVLNPVTGLYETRDYQMFHVMHMINPTSNSTGDPDPALDDPYTHMYWLTETELTTVGAIVGNNNPAIAWQQETITVQFSEPQFIEALGFIQNPDVNDNSRGCVVNVRMTNSLGEIVYEDWTPSAGNANMTLTKVTPFLEYPELGPAPVVFFDYAGGGTNTAVVEGSATGIQLPFRSDLSWFADRKIYYTVSGTANEGRGADDGTFPPEDVDHLLQEGGYFIFPAGATWGSIHWNDVVDDTEYEVPYENIIIKIVDADFSTIDSARDTFTFWIWDNDPVPPVAYMPVTAFNLPEPTQVPVFIEVKLLTTHNLDSRIQYTVSGTATPNVDHSLDVGGWVTIPAGQDSANINLWAVYDDPDYEVVSNAHETIVITLVRGRNAILSATAPTCTITIVDNDPDPSVPWGTPPPPIVVPPSQLSSGAGLVFYDKNGKIIWDSTTITWNFVDYFQVTGGATHTATPLGLAILKNFIVMRWMINVPPDDQTAITATITRVGNSYTVSGGNVTTAGLILGK